MTEINERIMQQIDRMTERADTAEQDARWTGPDVYACPRCEYWSEEEAACPNCGRDR